MSLVGTKPWLSNYIHCFLWDVITHSCYNMSSVRHQAITHTDADFLKIQSLDKLHWNLNPDKNTVFQRNTHENVMSMAQRKTAVTPLLTHWSYCSLALSHQCVKWKSFCSGLMVLTPETWWRHVASKILVNTVSDNGLLPADGILSVEIQHLCKALIVPMHHNKPTMTYLLLARWHQTISSTNVNLLSMRSSCIHSRVMYILNYRRFRCPSCVSNLHIWNHNHISQWTMR